jgi:hypothetical protein
MKEYLFSSDCFGGTHSTSGEIIMLGAATYAWEVPDDDIATCPR